MLYQNLPDHRNRIRPQPLARQFQPRQPYVAAVYQEPQRAHRIPKRSLAGIFIIALIAVIAFHSYDSSHGVAEAFSSLTTTSAQKAAAAKEARMATYKSTVNALIAAHPEETVTVSTIDSSGAQSLTLGDQGTYTAASTAKLITAVVVLHEVEQGKLNLGRTINGQSVRTLLQNMIVNSDNNAWQSLNDYLTHDTLMAYTTQLGWKDYDPDVNTLLPSDMALLAHKLYGGSLLNASHTSLLLSLMQQAGKQEYIVAGVPAGYSVYHKAGWLDGLMHDVAVISNGKQSVTLAIYTYNANAIGDNTANQELFKQITAAAISAYYPAT